MEILFIRKIYWEPFLWLLKYFSWSMDWLGCIGPSFSFNFPKFLLKFFLLKLTLSSFLVRILTILLFLFLHIFSKLLVIFIPITLFTGGTRKPLLWLVTFVDFVLDSGVRKNMEIFCTLIIALDEVLAALGMRLLFRFRAWAMGRMSLVPGVLYCPSFDILHWFHVLSPDHLPVWTLWSLLSPWNFLFLRSLLMINDFVEFDLTMFHGCVKVFFLLVLQSHLVTLFFGFLVVGMTGVGVGLGTIFMLYFKIIIYLLAWEALIFIFHIEIDLNIDIASAARFSSIFLSALCIFTHLCSYNYNTIKYSSRS